METSNHSKNGAKPKSHESRKPKNKKMKNVKSLIIASICVAIMTPLSAFKHPEVKEVVAKNCNNCGEWSKISGISMRQCSEDERYSYQFFNGYNFKVHFYIIMSYTDGTQSCSSDGCYINLYLDGEETSDLGENAGAGRKSINHWRLMSRERQDDNGNWVEF